MMMTLRTQKELSRALQELRTTGRKPSNSEHAEDLKDLINEVLAHPLTGFALANDAEYDRSIGEREVSASAEFDLLSSYSGSINGSSKFAGIYDSLHHMINLEMFAALRHQEHIEKMKDAGLWPEEE